MGNLVMNLTKQCSLVLLYSKYYDVCLRKYLHSSFRSYYFITNRKFPLVETVTVQHSPLKCFNFYLCTKTSVCWSCGTAVASLFCGNCNTLQKVNKKRNYFDLLGLDFNYDVKLSDLSQKYRQLQSVLHPDKFANKSSVSSLLKK